MAVDMAVSFLKDIEPIWGLSANEKKILVSLGKPNKFSA